MGSGQVNHYQFSSGDIDEHASALPGWDQCYSQLNRGAFAGELAHISLPGVTLFRETTNIKLRQDVTAPSGSVVFAMPLPGSAEGVFDHQPMDDASSLVLHGGVSQKFLCRDQMDLVAAVLDFRQLGDWGHALAEALSIRSGSVLRGPAVSQFAGMIADMVGELGTTLPQMLPQASLLSMPALIACRCLDLLRHAPLDERPPITSHQRYRLAARAREIIDGIEDNPPGLPVLAQQLGVSVRTLEYCFAEAIGLTPSVYIRNIRLNRARRDLRATTPGDHTVAEIAMKWGFWHLGRFATFYRQLFGESPSQTLRHHTRSTA